jgi:hypothetical protein
VVDCVRDSNQGGSGKFSPITFADGFIDEKTGEEKCCDPALFNKEDSLTKQSLDYIIMLKMKDNCKDLNLGNAFTVDINSTRVEKGFVEG